MKETTHLLRHITIIGTGNVGTHLARRIVDRGREIVQLYSRSGQGVDQLAAELDCAYATTLAELDPTADVYILAVPDAAIGPVACRLAALLPPDALVLHTSGATPVAPLAEVFERTGVFYPLQSFNREQPVDWTQVPILYFAIRPEDEAACAELAAILSPRTARVDDAQRARLHIAAVFANNFSNAFFEIAYRIATEAELDFELLLPLIRHTVDRLDGQTPPIHWQTGPAVRGDQVTIERHLRALADHPDRRELYRVLSDWIAEENPLNGQGPIN